jgi:hypothetical protein
MNTTPADFERMLREAVSKAKEAAPRAVDDLVHCASKAAEAVAGVTGSAAALELVPIDVRDEHGRRFKGATPTYQLQLRKVDSEAPPSDLGIFRVTETGYPVLRWYSRAKWEGHPEKPDEQYTTISELEGNFKWMLSNPDSRLVVLVSFFQQQAAEKEPAAEKKTKGRK